MAAVTARMVKDLRERTDLPMMECKQALTQCDGDIEASLEWLRKRHRGKMVERAGRATGEGRIGVYVDQARRVGALVELQCETAPVARNRIFIELADSLAKRVAEGVSAGPDPKTVRDDPDVERLFTDVFGRLREAMNLRQCRRVEGVYLSSYVHHDGKSGVLLALDAEPKSDRNIGADLCMHALFTQPIAIDRAGVSEERVAQVRREAVELAQAEGKPEPIVGKIADGKVNAFFAQYVLMEQLHVKTDDYGKKKICDCLREAGVQAVTDLAIMKVGGSGVERSVEERGARTPWRP